MNEFYIGNSIFGNFKPIIQLPDIKETQLVKKDNTLYLRRINQPDCALEPIDENAENVLFQFEVQKINDIDPIYKIIKNKEKIGVELYVYEHTEEIPDNRKMIIHTHESDENVMCKEKGLVGLKAKYKNEITSILTNTFISNNSIFVQENQKRSGILTIYGKYKNKGYRATLEKEDGGKYVIHNFKPVYNTDNIHALTRVCVKNIKFVLDFDSLTIAGDKNTTITFPTTNEIFKAWDKYMEVEYNVYKNELKSSIYIVDKFDYNPDGIFIELKDKKIEWEDIKNKDYEFVFCSSDDEIINNFSSEKIIKYKEENKNAPIFLGEAIIFDNDKNVIKFKLPERKELDESMKNTIGILYLSDFSLKNEQNRRNKVIGIIDAKTNKTACRIMRLCSPEIIDTSIGTNYKPITKEVLREMFGNTDVELKENYVKAMDIALNTPDIALIQGPPGTGKTTLINGLIARLNSENKSYRILLATEQHEALENVVSKVSNSETMPPFITSKRKNEDENEVKTKFEENISRFQSSCIKICDDYLKTKQNNNYSNKLVEAVSIIQEIIDSDYSKNTINKNIANLSSILYNICINDGEVINCFRELSLATSNMKIDSKNNLDPATTILIKRINSQRLNLVSFADDGPAQVLSLHDTLQRMNNPPATMDENLYTILMGNNEEKIKENFETYVKFVNELKKEFTFDLDNEFENNKNDIRIKVKNLQKAIFDFNHYRKMNTDDIIETFSHMIGDTGTISRLIRKYTPVIGSTCAQAQRSVLYADLTEQHYDYVIIDEAARANPVDIMIPMIMGSRILLVGDQNQLPHYVEDKIIREFEKNPDLYSNEDKKLLKTSLFKLLYENLENAYKEGRIKYKRTIMLDEQHRMHKDIGDFISEEFYNGGLKSDVTADEKINEYGVFESKSIVAINIPITKNPETKGKSISRKVEADKTIEILREIISKNRDKKISIGIITYYNDQKDMLEQMMKNNFPEYFQSIKISCDTVDSCQGKEYDIVIINGTRSNARHNIGFIKDSSRINVSLSRAKRLLIFIGDEETYSTNDHFYNYFKYAKNKEKGHYETVN